MTDVSDLVLPLPRINHRACVILTHSLEQLDALAAQRALAGHWGPDQAHCPRAAQPDLMMQFIDTRREEPLERSDTLDGESVGSLRAKYQRCVRTLAPTYETTRFNFGDGDRVHLYPDDAVGRRRAGGPNPVGNRRRMLEIHEAD